MVEKKFVRDKRIIDLINQIGATDDSTPTNSNVQDLEKIRSDLTKAATEKTKQLNVQNNLDSRIAKLKAGVEGVSTNSPLDFKRVDFKPHNSDDKIKAIGEVYQSFEGVLFTFSQFLASLPISTSLRTSLKCAGMKWDAETYVAVVSTVSLIVAIFLMILIPAVGITAGFLNISDVLMTSLLILVSGLFSFILIGIVGLAYPNLKAKSRGGQIDRELPFALRHLATQMGAGMSFQKALSSVASADYGVLSTELQATLARMDSGMSTEDALLDLSERTYSQGLKQTTIQIVRSLRTGGKISEIISTIAEDVAFETRMKVRDFTESLNLVSIVYIMVSVVAPVVTTIMTAILQLPILGSGLSPLMITLIFSGLSFAMVVILFFIKQLEPMS